MYLPSETVVVIPPAGRACAADSGSGMENKRLAASRNETILIFMAFTILSEMLRRMSFPRC